MIMKVIEFCGMWILFPSFQPGVDTQEDYSFWNSWA